MSYAWLKEGRVAKEALQRLREKGEKPFLTPLEVAVEYGISWRYLQRRQTREFIGSTTPEGKPRRPGPPYIREKEKLVRYRRADVEEWLARFDGDPRHGHHFDRRDTLFTATRNAVVTLDGEFTVRDIITAIKQTKYKFSKTISKPFWRIREKLRELVRSGEVLQIGPSTRGGRPNTYRRAGPHEGIS